MFKRSAVHYSRTPEAVTPYQRAAQVWDDRIGAANDYARNNDPFAKLGKTQIAIEVSSVIRASPASFRLAWIERRYDTASLP